MTHIWRTALTVSALRHPTLPSDEPREAAGRAWECAYHWTKKTSKSKHLATMTEQFEAILACRCFCASRYLENQAQTTAILHKLLKATRDTREM